MGLAVEFERRGVEREASRWCALEVESLRRGVEGLVTMICRGRELLFERLGGMTRYLEPSSPYEISGLSPVGILTPAGRTEMVSARRGTLGRDEL